MLIEIYEDNPHETTEKVQMVTFTCTNDCRYWTVCSYTYIPFKKQN